MKHLPKILFYAGLAGIVFLFPASIFAVSDSVNVELEVTGCNNNGVCESSLGETAQNCAPDCLIPSGSGNDPGEFGLYIKNILTSQIGFDSAKISWQTTKPASCNVMLGATQDYEKETFSETNLNAEHSLDLNNLLIGSGYHFKILCVSGSGMESESGDKYFSTLNVLGNPSNFKAEGADKKIYLTWKNPENADFSGVKIVKNNYFYPAEPEGGITIYNGKGENFTDENLKNSQTYYYAIFAYDKKENYSSGALAFGTAFEEQKEKEPEKEAPPKKEQIPPAEQPALLEKISINDFTFYASSKGKIEPDSQQRVSVKAGDLMALSIDYGKIPAFYRKMMISIDVKNDRFSYLFSPNEEKTLFVSSFKIPPVAGEYPMQIIFFDSANDSVKTINGKLKIYKEIKIFAGWTFPRMLINIILLALLLLLLIIKRCLTKIKF